MTRRSLPVGLEHMPDPELGKHFQPIHHDMLGHVVRGLDLHETASVMEAVEFRPYPDLIAGNRELVGDRLQTWLGGLGHRGLRCGNGGRRAGWPYYSDET